MRHTLIIRLAGNGYISYSGISKVGNHIKCPHKMGGASAWGSWSALRPLASNKDDGTVALIASIAKKK